MSGSKRVARKWQVFPGRNSFFCDGRIVMAQQTGLFYFCVILILFTSVLFFVFDCPYLSSNVSPAIPFVAAVLFVSVMSNLLKTSFSDPGILPRATFDEAADNEKQVDRAFCKFLNWRDSISRPIAPISSVACGDDTANNNNINSYLVVYSSIAL
jgi:palmitoyltransferase ZDHHC9/14/18